MREDKIDWVEDYPHENGNYLCSCTYCYRQFYGYKRRIVCKECHTDTVDQKEHCWIVRVDMDSFNYVMGKVYLFDVVKHNKEVEDPNEKIKAYFTETEAQKECEYLNSM